jgi:hypothetical protein
MQSFNPRYHVSNLLLLPLLLLAGMGCASPNTVARDASRLDFATIARGAPAPGAAPTAPVLAVPFVLHVAAGQEVPVDFRLSSRLFALDTGPLKLVAKRDFYVLFRGDGPPLISEDGQEFEERVQNTFRFGLRVVQNEPATVELFLGIRPDPAPVAPGAN